jgi:GNAT superfamily N-acetyltransferase/ribosomal protein S27AE
MDVRPATAADGPRIADVARSSLQTSYALSPVEIDTLVEQQFSADAVEARVDDPDGLFLVVAGDVEIDTEDDADSDAVGFVEVDADNTLRWLHVDPVARGRGAGSALVEAVRDRVDEADAPVTARILETASEGRQFLERFDLSQTGTTDLEVDGERFTEHVYTPGEDESDAAEPSVEVPETVTVDGRDLTLDRDDEVPATEAPFFGLFETDDDSRWGFFCSECGSSDVAADSLDRLECSNCGNTHVAEQWDGAYL